MRNFYFGSGDFEAAARLLVEMTEEQYAVLHRAVTSAEAFTHSFSRLKSLADQLGGNLDANAIFSLLTYLEFLYSRCRAWEADGESPQENLKEFLELTGLNRAFGDSAGKGYQRLLPLLEKNPALQQRQKIRRLRTGILPTAVSFSSFVDLRPYFDEPRTAIEGIIPVVIFRVVTESEYGEEDPKVFQMNLAGVAKLRSALEDVEKKLVAIQSDRALSPRLELDKNLPEGEEP